MTMNSVLADTIARLNNAQRARHDFTLTKSSKLVKSVLEVLKREGYITSYEEFEQTKGIKVVKVDLKYHNEQPAIREFQIISKPGCRVYSSVKDLKRPYNGLGTLILSTSKQSVISDHEARDQNIGGEVLCMVY